MIYIKLFFSFLKIGIFSFGGGYAMIPLMKTEMVIVNQWMTMRDFLDMMAVSEMTPGPISINLATFLGYKVGGVLGSLIASFGVLLPSIIIITLIYYIVKKFEDSKYVKTMFKSIRPITLGLVTAGFLTIFSSGVIDVKTFVLFLIYLFLSLVIKLHPILILTLSGLISVFIF